MKLLYSVAFLFLLLGGLFFPSSSTAQLPTATPAYTTTWKEIAHFDTGFDYDRVRPLTYLSPNGQMFLTTLDISAKESVDLKMRVYDLATMMIIFEPSLEGNLSNVRWEWSPDNDHFAIWGNHADEFNIEIWSINKAQRTALLQGHQTEIRDVKWSPDGEMLVASSKKGAVYLWNKAGYRVTTLLEEEKNVFEVSRSIEWNPKINLLLMEGKIWDFSERGSISYPLDISVYSAPEWSPDGKYLASIKDDVEIIVWDTELRRTLNVLRDPDLALSIAWLGWHPHENMIYALSHGYKDIYESFLSEKLAIRIWDINTSEVISTISDFQDYFVEVTWSANGEYFMIYEWGRIRVWDKLARSLLLIAPTPGFTHAGFSNDGDYIVAPYNVDFPTKQSLRIWSVQENRPIAGLPVVAGEFGKFWWSSNDEYIVFTFGYILSIWTKRE